MTPLPPLALIGSNSEHVRMRACSAPRSAQPDRLAATSPVARLLSPCKQSTVAEHPCSDLRPQPLFSFLCSVPLPCAATRDFPLSACRHGPHGPQLVLQARLCLAETPERLRTGTHRRVCLILAEDCVARAAR